MALSLGVIYGGVRNADHVICTRTVDTAPGCPTVRRGVLVNNGCSPLPAGGSQFETLSPREREVLELLSEGLSTRASPPPPTCPTTRYGVTCRRRSRNSERTIGFMRSP